MQLVLIWNFGKVAQMSGEVKERRWIGVASFFILRRW
jgi:hypothetical protein